MTKVLNLLTILMLGGGLAGCSIKGSGLPGINDDLWKTSPKLLITTDPANAKWNQMDYDREQGVKVRVTQEYMIPESTAFTHLRVEGSQWMSMECDISLVRLNVTVESRRADGSVDHAVELRVEDPSHDHIIVLEPAFQQSLMVTAENIPDTCQMLSYSFMVMGVNL